MQTKLSVFCDRILEAGWLMAAILAPLYFNVYSNRVFEPDKISLVRSIALIMSLAWVVKMLESAMLSGRGGVSTDGHSQPLLQRIMQHNMLAIPTLILVASYIISTLGSVAPMITLWGSYQRLQGTFSTFSYIVIFFLAAGTINRREQLDRVISVIILTSLPTAIYGIVEHLKLEFLPWGGDVTIRVTSTMGNPIFIAAYLIMVVPFALGRFIERLSSFLASAGGGEGKNGSRSTTAMLVLIATLQAVAWYVVVHYGLRIYGDSLLGQPSTPLDMAILLVGLILAVILPLTVRKGTALLLITSFYGVAVLIDLAGVWYSQSRGPELGLLAGMIIFVFLYTMKRNSKVMFYAGLSAAFVVVLILGIVQLPNSPLSFLRPSLGRVGTLVDEGSSVVRSLIWQGARQLIGDHAPVGVQGLYVDQLNSVRPLIGYGPEAMYVAYNSFYPPDLAHHEARNASPDRSHNDTLDALVMTGVLGYFAYWLVFYSFIYVGLRLLGLIEQQHGRYLYLALLLCGPIALAIIYSDILPIQFTPGPPLLGVVVLGIYLLLAAFFLYDWKGKSGPFDLVLIALVSAVVAHFVEIQFGFGVASTDVHFWLYGALIIAAGRLMQKQETAPEETKERLAAPVIQERPVAAAVAVAASRPPATTASFSSKKKNKTVAAGRPRQETRPGGGRPPVPRSPAGPVPSRRPVARTDEQGLWALILQVAPRVLPLAVAGGIILATLAFDLILPKGSSAQPPRTTSVQFWIYFLTWLACGMIVAFDSPYDARVDEVNQRIAALIVFTGVSLAMWLIYVVMRGVVDSPAAGQVEQIPLALVSLFYIFLLLFGLALAASLYAGRPAEAQRAWSGPVAGVIYAVIAVVTILFAVSTNVNSVLADVYYKTGLAYDGAQRYDGSIQTYEKAINLQPGQDFYYLFLGRSYMELARQFPDRKANPPFDPKVESPLTITRERLSTLGRMDLIQSSLAVLLEARSLNPLNTDHTANLARLYTFWGEVSGDASKLAQSDQYYEEATTLSPNNAQLWAEWACIYGRFCLYWTDSPDLQAQFDHALTKLQQAVKLDDRYDVAQSYLGNLYVSRGERIQPQNVDYFAKAAEAYTSCLALTPGQADCSMSRGYVDSRYLNKPTEAIADFQKVLGSLPTPQQAISMTNASDKQQAIAGLTRVYQNMALTYAQIGDYDQAVAAIQIAVQLNPTDQALKALLDQYKQQQKK